MFCACVNTSAEAPLGVERTLGGERREGGIESAVGFGKAHYRNSKC